MRPVRMGVGVLAMLLLAAVPTRLWAGTAVGTLVQVEGDVEILRQGKLPPSPAQRLDSLNPGDVIRTKSNARAQVRFLDDSLLTIAPGSMVAINEYLYDAPQGLRRAVVNVFRGLVYSVVRGLLRAEQPTFLMKTHTALLGVRGTEWYTLLGASYTAAFVETGQLEVSSLQKEVVKKVVLLSGETSTVALEQAPTDPVRYPEVFRRLLKDWLRNGVPEWVIGMPPLELPWLKEPLRLPRVPEHLREFPEGLFVPPTIRAPEQPGKPNVR
jgi:hypothetical protein